MGLQLGYNSKYTLLPVSVLGPCIGAAAIALWCVQLADSSRGNVLGFKLTNALAFSMRVISPRRDTAVYVYTKLIVMIREGRGIYDTCSEMLKLKTLNKCS